MLQKLFGKSKGPIEVFSPMDGTFVALKDVPDPVFSEEMMGKGFAVKPTNGTVVSPVDGKITQVFPTKHAIGIETNEGLELLVHIGLDTVSMNGEGFNTHVDVGNKVSIGDRLVTFDIDLVQSKANSSISPIIITNSDNLNDFNIEEVTDLTKGTSKVLKVTLN